MKIEQIDRLCGVFEQRLKSGEKLSREQFLREQRLPLEEPILHELRQLEEEYQYARPEFPGAERKPAPSDIHSQTVLLPGRGGETMKQEHEASFTFDAHSRWSSLRSLGFLWHCCSQRSSRPKKQPVARRVKTISNRSGSPCTATTMFTMASLRRWLRARVDRRNFWVRIPRAIGCKQHRNMVKAASFRES